MFSDFLYNSYSSFDISLLCLERNSANMPFLIPSGGMIVPSDFTILIQVMHGRPSLHANPFTVTSSPGFTVSGVQPPFRIPLGGLPCSVQGVVRPLASFTFTWMS